MSRAGGSRRGRVVRPEPGARRPGARWGAGALIVVLLALGAAWVAFGSQWWVVRSVDVRVEAPPSTAPWSEQVADPAQVQRVSGIRVGDRVATLPRSEARERLEEVPGVAVADVGRGLTGTVVLELRLEEAVATRARGDEQEVLAASGEVITTVPDGAAPGGDEAGDTPALPELQLADGVPEGQADRAVSRAVGTLAVMSDEMRQEVREYRASESGLATLLPDSRVVHWGHVTDEADLRERERSVRAILTEQPPAPGATLDATQRGAVVVHEG